jgi:hypothetical protein
MSLLISFLVSTIVNMTIILEEVGPEASADPKPQTPSYVVGAAKYQPKWS